MPVIQVKLMVIQSQQTQVTAVMNESELEEERCNQRQRRENAPKPRPHKVWFCFWLVAVSLLWLDR